MYITGSTRAGHLFSAHQMLVLYSVAHISQGSLFLLVVVMRISNFEKEKHLENLRFSSGVIRGINTIRGLLCFDSMDCLLIRRNDRILFFNDTQTLHKGMKKKSSSPVIYFRGHSSPPPYLNSPQD